MCSTGSVAVAARDGLECGTTRHFCRSGGIFRSTPRPPLLSICKKKSASQAVLSRMQLTLHATRRTPSRRFALDASSVCLVGVKPNVLRPGIVGMRGGSIVIQSRPCMSPSTPPAEHASSPARPFLLPRARAFCSLALTAERTERRRHDNPGPRRGNKTGGV